MVDSVSFLVPVKRWLPVGEKEEYKTSQQGRGE